MYIDDINLITTPKNGVSDIDLPIGRTWPQ